MRDLKAHDDERHLRIGGRIEDLQRDKANRIDVDQIETLLRETREAVAGLRGWIAASVGTATVAGAIIGWIVTLLLH